MTYSNLGRQSRRGKKEVCQSIFLTFFSVLVNRPLEYLGEKKKKKKKKTFSFRACQSWFCEVYYECSRFMEFLRILTTAFAFERIPQSKSHPLDVLICILWNDFSIQNKKKYEISKKRIKQFSWFKEKTSEIKMFLRQVI